VRAVDAGVHDDDEKTPYLVEEYVDGIDLAELDRRRRRALGVGLPLWFVCHVMHALGEGLRAAHQVGVLHRDLKPSNAFAAPGTGGIRLGDFGLAVARNEAPEAGISGTLRFMAPEQLRGEAVSRATDVYGAGATAYDLRYGRPPFLDAESVMNAQTGPPFPAARTPAEAYFQNVLAAMLQKRVEDRPRDMCEPARHFLALANALRPRRTHVACVPTGRDEMTLGGVVLRLKAGDISESQADAIVSSANDAMAMRTGTGDALRKRGGDAIEQEALAGGRQPLGACVATGAGTLAAKHVFHAVSAWNEASCIGRTMCRALILADELGHGTLAMPALGTGRAHVNIETCARAMISGLMWHLALGGSRLKRVEIVLGSEEKLAVFREVVGDVVQDDIDAGVGDLGYPVDDAPVLGDGATFLDGRKVK
jgi:serine/threonine-protein kinase